MNKIDWVVLSKLCMQVGAAVDLAKHTMSAARRDPNGWRIEADVEAIQDMQAEIIAQLNDVITKLIDINRGE